MVPVPVPVRYRTSEPARAEVPEFDPARANAERWFVCPEGGYDILPVDPEGVPRALDEGHVLMAEMHQHTGMFDCISYPLRATKNESGSGYAAFVGRGKDRRFMTYAGRSPTHVLDSSDIVAMLLRKKN